MNKKESEFNKVFSAWDILVIAFGAMIGWGWVVSTGGWIEKGGVLGAALGFVIGGIMIFFVGMTYAELTAAMPQCGGEHVFSYRAMGATGSFICTWMIVLGYVSVACFEACAFPTIITYLWPGFLKGYLYTVAGFDIYASWLIVAIVVAFLIMLINIIGAKTAAILQTVLTCIIGGAGILLIVASVINGSADNLNGQMFAGASAGVNLKAIIGVAALSPFYFIGFDVIPQAAEEINVPYKKIGKIMLLSIFLAVAWYLLIIFAVCYIMPQSAIAQEMSSQNGLVSAKAIEIAFRSPLMGKVLIIGGLCGIITSWNSFLMGGSRALYSMGESLMIPKMFGKLGKHKTPEAAIILCGIACVVAPFFGRGVLVWLVDAASFGCVIAYMFVSISFCILRKKKPEMARPYKVKAGRFVGVMAVLMAGFMTLLYIVPASFSAALVWQEWIVVGIWLALGAFFYFYSKKKYGAEFGRDIFIVEDGGKTEEQEETVLPNAKYPDRHFVITVGCEYGSGGPQIAKMVADRLGIEYYNRDLVDKVVAHIGVDKGLVEEADTKIGVRYAFDTSYGVRYANLSNRVIDAQFQAINDFANRSSCVIVGRSSDYILRNRDDVLNVFIYAPQEDEIAAVMKEKGIKNMRKAKEEWESVDKAQHARHEYITGKKRGDRHTRDMLINSSILGWDETADMIIDMIDRKFEQDDAKQLKKEA